MSDLAGKEPCFMRPGTRGVAIIFRAHERYIRLGIVSTSKEGNNTVDRRTPDTRDKIGTGDWSVTKTVGQCPGKLETTHDPRQFGNNCGGAAETSCSKTRSEGDTFTPK